MVGRKGDATHRVCDCAPKTIMQRVLWCLGGGVRVITIEAVYCGKQNAVGALIETRGCHRVWEGGRFCCGGWDDVD